MKKVLISILCISLSCMSAFSQMSLTDFQGSWTLTSLEGNDNEKSLSQSQILESTKNYLHDFPLKSTTLTFNGANFILTHHGGASIFGTFEFNERTLQLKAPKSDCSSCPPKTIEFVIKSKSTGTLILDIFDEDEGSTSFAHLTFTK
jgi:hypothetical protein